MNAVRDITVGEIEQFLYQEARVLDEWDLDRWLALWSGEGCCYWVPVGGDDYNPDERVSLIYDDWDLLRQRVARLSSPAAHVQDPRSRLCRLISNTELLETSEGEVRTSACFSLAEYRNGVQRSYWGRMYHTLEIVGGKEFRIREKKVVLVSNPGFFDNVTIPF